LAVRQGEPVTPNNKQMKIFFTTILILMLTTGCISLSNYGYHRIFWQNYALENKTIANYVNERNGKELCFISYNICYGSGGENKPNMDEGHQATASRLNQIARMINLYDADFVVFNEIDFKRYGSNNVNQALFVAAQTRLNYLVEQRNIDCRALFYNFQQGNALLSRYPVESLELVEFPSYSGWESRFGGKANAFIAKIKLPDNSVIALCVTHLESRSSEVRKLSVAIIEAKRKTSSEPFFLIGDLNCSPPEWPQEQPDSAFNLLIQNKGYNLSQVSVPDQNYLTIPVGKPYKAVDWILVPPEWHIALCQRLALDVSDHYPVILKCYRNPDMLRNNDRTGSETKK
jgi:endonuclease/exonuclease/phosphatase family metal-dependent hydrolase